MSNDDLIKAVRSGGAWALGNHAAEYTHYFLQAPGIGRTVISACWARVATLENLTLSDVKPRCPECEYIRDNRKDGAYRITHD